MKRIGFRIICAISVSLLLILTSCNSTFNKPLLEPLTEDEEMMLTDDQAQVYKLLKRYITMHAIAGSPKLEHLNKISYKEFFNYFEIVNAQAPQWSEEAKEEWNKKYTQTVEQAIACYDKWLKWEKENNLTSKIEVKLVSIDKIGFPNTFTLSFKSEIGPIESINVDFGFGERTNHNFYESYPKDKLVTEGVVIEDSYIDLPDDFKNMSMEEALKKYPFCYEVVSAKVVDASGNIKLYLGSDHLEEIPGPVLVAMSKVRHKEITNLEGETFHEAINNIATKVLNLDYTTPQDYIDNYCYGKCEELDETISELHRSLMYFSNHL